MLQRLIVCNISSATDKVKKVKKEKKNDVV